MISKFIKKISFSQIPQVDPGQCIVCDATDPIGQAVVAIPPAFFDSLTVLSTSSSGGYTSSDTYGMREGGKRGNPYLTIQSEQDKDLIVVGMCMVLPQICIHSTVTLMSLSFTQVISS